MARFEYMRQFPWYMRGLFHAGRYLYKRGKPGRFLFKRHAREGANLAIKAAAAGSALFPEKKQSGESDMAPSKSRSRSRGRTMDVSDPFNPTPSGRSRSRSKSIAPTSKRPRVVKKKAVPRVRVSLPSKSAGKFTSGTKVSKARKELSIAQNKGLIMTEEVGISTTSGVTDAIYIGHSTWVRDEIRENFFRVLLKTLLAKMGVPVRSIKDPLPLKQNDVFTLDWIPEVNGALQSSVVTLGATPADNTLQLIATALLTVFELDADHLTGPLFQRIQYRNAGDTYRVDINLIHAKIKLHIKSALKLQNQTTASGADSENVDNIPVYGKSYEGLGNGAFTNAQVTPIRAEYFVATASNGVILQVGTVATGMSEQPPPKYFKNVKKFGKAMLEPGEIKTSILTDTNNYSVPYLSSLLYSNNSSLQYYRRGSFRFFGLEHMIQATASTPSIKVVGEINWRCAMQMDTKWVNQTDEYAKSTYVTY